MGIILSSSTISPEQEWSRFFHVGPSTPVLQGFTNHIELRSVFKVGCLSRSPMYSKHIYINRESPAMQAAADYSAECIEVESR